jgi:DNA repair protein RecO (recombination protein O)
LFAAYGEVRARLAGPDPVAWTLRRFERDLLDAIGFGLWSDLDADGTPIDPAARYRLDPEQGARRVRSDRGQGDRDTAATGRALLDLAADTPARARRRRQPAPRDARGARAPPRRARLKSWDMLAELGRLSRPRAA